MDDTLAVRNSVTSVEVVRDSARLRELGDRWRELWAHQSSAGLFQSFEYCLDAWELVEEPSGRSLACLVGWHGDRLVAVWPFVTYRSRLWRHARPLVASGVELHEMLLDGSVDPAEWVQRAWAALCGGARVDVVDVSFFDESPAAAALGALPARAVESGEVACVRVELRAEGDWNAYYESLSKSHRKDFAKARRRLEALGPIEFSVLDAGNARIDSLVDWILTQKRVWAERTGKKGEWLYSDRYREFLLAQLSRPGSSARNVLLTLTVGGDLVAAQMGATSGTRFDAVIAGFSADYSKYSPGGRMNEAMLHWAWEQGLDCELGAGTEPYKTFWSRNRATPIRLRRLAVTRWGLVALAARRAAVRLGREQPGRRA